MFWAREGVGSGAGVESSALETCVSEPDGQGEEGLGQEIAGERSPEVDSADDSLHVEA